MLWLTEQERSVAEPLGQRRTRWRAADVIIDALVHRGVRVIFGVPGGTIAALNDALLDRPEIRTVTTRHESGAMFAAAGYARASGKLGVVTATSGPGVLNCMTGLASAYCDGVPLLLIAGEVPRAVFGKGALQEGSANGINVVGMARNVTKLALELTDPNMAAAAIEAAMQAATSGRPGPVFLSIPLDVSTSGVERPGIIAEVSLGASVDPGVLRKVATTLDACPRAVILAGSGARWGRGPQELLALAERLQVPVMTTPKGKGVFPESHPLSLGVFGHGGHPSATAFLEGGVEVLLAVGTGMSDAATNGWSPLLRPSQHLIQIDVDARQLGRNYPVSLGIVGAAESVLAGIRQQLPHRVRLACRYGVTMHTDAESFAVGPNGRITPQRALWELQQALPRTVLYTCDIGQHMLFATHYLQIDHPQAFMIMTGLASMGGAIAGAVGVKTALPGRPVCAVVGDGCLLMSFGDLATVAREGVPMLVAVIDDQRYGMVETGNLAIYGRTPAYACEESHVAELAQGLGLEAAVAHAPGDILALAPRLSDLRAPLVLDIQIDRGVKMPMNARFDDLAKAAGNKQR